MTLTVYVAWVLRKTGEDELISIHKTREGAGVVAEIAAANRAKSNPGKAYVEEVEVLS